MIYKSQINEVKSNIENLVGQKVRLRGSLGRNKTFEKEGTLIEANSHNFLVKTDSKLEKINYNYTDVLTNTVELSVNKGGEYNSILDIINQNNNSNQIL